MVVKLCTDIAFATGAFYCGDVVELPDAYASKLIASGQAERVSSSPVSPGAKIETAMLAHTPDPSAVRRKGRFR